MRSGAFMADRLLLKVPEAAESLGISTRATYRLIRSGELRAVKVGTVWRVEVAALHEFIGRLDTNWAV